MARQEPDGIRRGFLALISAAVPTAAESATYHLSAGRRHHPTPPTNSITLPALRTLGPDLHRTVSGHHRVVVVGHCVRRGLQRLDHLLVMLDATGGGVALGSAG